MRSSQTLGSPRCVGSRRQRKCKQALSIFGRHAVGQPALLGSNLHSCVLTPARARMATRKRLSEKRLADIAELDRQAGEQQALQDLTAACERQPGLAARLLTELRRGKFTDQEKTEGEGEGQREAKPLYRGIKTPQSTPAWLATKIFTQGFDLDPTMVAAIRGGKGRSLGDREKLLSIALGCGRTRCMRETFRPQRGPGMH